MNILPKKRWHVRTKENIARVRKDEAEAAEKERLERLRTEIADREARLNVLKFKSKQTLLELGFTPQQTPDKDIQSEHVNLFANLEDAVKTTNKEHDKELKDKKEEYEKKIGYLTYLGQDTNEALGKKNWYEVLPDTSKSTRSSDIKDSYEKLVLKDVDGKPKTKELDEVNEEVGWHKKQSLDPLNTFKHLHQTNKDKGSSLKNNKCNGDHTSSSKQHKHKSKKYKYDDKQKKLQKLREARLKREQQEKYRTEIFLTGLNKCTSTECEKVATIRPKYNSQFNPELARQNYR